MRISCNLRAKLLVQADTRCYSYLPSHDCGRNHGFKANEGFFRLFCSDEGNSPPAPPSTDHSQQVISCDFNFLLFISNLSRSNYYLGCATLFVIYNCSSRSLFFLCLQQLLVSHYVRFPLSFDHLHHIILQQVFSLKCIFGRQTLRVTSIKWILDTLLCVCTTHNDVALVRLRRPK